MRCQKLATLAAVVVLATLAALLRHGVAPSRHMPPTHAGPILGPGPAVLRAITVDPRDGSLIRATTQGLSVSADGGRRWKPLSIPAPLVQSNIRQIIMYPERPTVILAAGLGTGIIVSEDAGATWRPSTAGLPSRDLETVAIHAFRRETLFVSVRGKGIYRTENGGKQWQRMDNGPASQPVLTLAHSPLSGSMNTGWLYAGTPQGPYISMDCF